MTLSDHRIAKAIYVIAKERVYVILQLLFDTGSSV